MANFLDLKDEGFNGGRPTLKQIDRLTEKEYSALMKKHPVRRRYASGCRETYRDIEEEAKEVNGYRGVRHKNIRDCE